MWEATVAHLRSTARADLKEWEALALVLRELWSVWDNAETRRQRRENPTLERDGWRCTAPGCWSIGTGRLHEHHIIPRAAGGSVSDPLNVTACCAQHHLGLLHEGLIRCMGRASHELLWEMGVEPGREPFELFRGETRVTRSAADEMSVA